MEDYRCVESSSRTTEQTTKYQNANFPYPWSRLAKETGIAVRYLYKCRVCFSGNPKNDQDSAVAIARHLSASAAFRFRGTPGVLLLREVRSTVWGTCYLLHDAVVVTDVTITCANSCGAFLSCCRLFSATPCRRGHGRNCHTRQQLPLLLLLLLSVVFCTMPSNGCKWDMRQQAMIGRPWWPALVEPCRRYFVGCEIGT